MSRAWALAGGLALLALVLNLRAVATAPFHPDETRWLNRAHYLRDLLDPFGPTWRDGYLTRGQPPLASYLMGLGLTLQGRDLATNGVWDFHHGAAWNTARGNMADPADLRAGRRTNAVIGALAVLFAALTAMRLTNLAGGTLTGLALATHPLMQLVASQALADALLLALVAAAALAATSLATRPGWGRALLLGGLLGLGSATKLTPLLVSLPLAALGGVLWWRAGPAAVAARRLGRCLLAVPAIAGAVFVLAYPYLWPDPLGRTLALATFRAEEMARQGANWPDVAVGNRGEALSRVLNRLVLDYSGSGQLAAGLRGVDVALGLGGLAALLWFGWREWRTPRRLLPAALLLAQGAVVVLGLRADYARYHLPLVLLMATGIGGLGGLAWDALVARRDALIVGWHAVGPRALPSGHSLLGLVGLIAALLAIGAGFSAQAPRRDVLAAQASPASLPGATPAGGASPVAATPVGGATPLAATPVAFATPVAASPVAVAGTPVALGGVDD